MPDYSDEEIDKASDELSDGEEVMVDGKLIPRRLLEQENVKFIQKNEFIKLFFFLIFFSS